MHIERLLVHVKNGLCYKKEKEKKNESKKHIHDALYKFHVEDHRYTFN